MKHISKTISFIFCITFLMLICSCVESQPIINKYTVTFKDFDGTVLREEIIQEGHSATAPKDFGRYGYIFIGWDCEYTNIQKDTVCIAQYERDLNVVLKYTVTFIDHDGVILKEETVEEGKNATAPKDPIREGYTFIGWSEDFENIQKDVIALAKYEKEPVKYKVKFVDFDGTILNEEYVEEGKKATEFVPLSKEGYIFKGWYINEEKWNFLGYTITEDIVLEAQWELDTYLIEFDTNGGNKVDNINYTIESDNLNLPIPTKNEYIFVGWYLNNEKIEQIKKGTIGNINLKAKWEENIFTFELSEDSSYYTVTGLKSKDYTDIKIPSIYNGLPVLNIAEKAFTAQRNLISVEIPNSIKSIKKLAFAFCSGLESINYKGTIEDWCKISFSGANSNPMTYAEKIYMLNENNEYYEVVKIEIPETITSIGTYQFYKFQNLKEIIISNNTTTIDISAFQNCTNLESITLSNSVTSIGEDAFTDCQCLENIYYQGTIEDWFKISFNKGSSNPMVYAKRIYMLNENNEYYEVTEIEIPETITSIGAYQFYKFKNLCSVIISNNVTNIGKSSFRDCINLENLIISEGVKNIENFAFSGCTSLENIVIPNSVTNVEDNAFGNCIKLKNIKIGEGLNSIGVSSFDNCISLECIEIDINNKIYDSRNNCNAIIITETNELLKGCNGTIIPNSVTSIMSSAFKGYINLESIIIPESVINIDKQAFNGCDSLTKIEVDKNNKVYDSRENCNAIIVSETNELLKGCNGTTIPNSVTSIGSSAFYNCTSLESIEIPNGVTSIGSSAFYNCTSLESIEIPNSVTSIENSAFSNCTSLEKLYFKGIIEDWCKITFGYSNANPMKHAKNIYMLNENNEYYEVTEIEIPKTITSIGAYQFDGFEKLTKVTIGENITSIGNHAFSDCTSLTIYCEATFKPEGWHSNWNYSNCPVVWGYVKE